MPTSVQLEPEFREFIEAIVQDLGWGLVPDQAPEEYERLLQQAGKQFKGTFLDVFCRALPPDHVDDFLQMVAQNTPLRERQTYLRRHIHNLSEVAEMALAEFREGLQAAMPHELAVSTASGR